MSRFQQWQRRALALAFGISAGVAGVGATRVAPAFFGGPSRAAVTVTAAEVRASNAKVRDAFGALVDVWGPAVADVGGEFEAPDLVAYRGATPSACGVMRANNAGYCVRDNTIYYDDVFVAGQAKSAAQQLGTDGDMAAVGVIAHEMGHAVAMQLGYLSRVTYDNERVADCLAGAFTYAAGQRGELERGDVEEAFFGMASAADPTPELTGDRRVDRAILVRAALMGHGTREQRMSNFRAGLDRGAGACLPEFR